MALASLLVRAAAFALALAGADVAQASDLPKGFVYLRDVDASIRQDMRYAGSHNFIGRPIAGYAAPECVLTEQAAHALMRVQAALAPLGRALIVWDCYRPARAVREFVRWIGEPDARMKGEFYPHTDKTRLVALGYIASRSMHSSGSTVDLGLVPLSPATPAAPNVEMPPLVSCIAPVGQRFADGTVDLGTGFDCFDDRARFAHPGLGAAARENRAILRGAMMRYGFAPYEREWWHFRLADQPFPHRAFDFPIPPRVRPAQ
jgi:zinc D-Ala-D-Ala dipeptidase